MSSYIAIKRERETSTPHATQLKKREVDDGEIKKAIDDLKQVLFNKTFSRELRQVCDSELLRLTACSPINEIPPEMLMKILGYLPQDRKTLRLVSKTFKNLVDDVFRLRDLEDAFNKIEGFSIRLQAHIKVVEARLKKANKEPTPTNVYLELIHFQNERFPPAPFVNGADPSTVDGYLEREKIIKNWNTYLMAKSVLVAKGFFPKGIRLTPLNKTDLEAFCNEVDKLSFTHSRILDLRSLNLTEIPDQIKRFGASLEGLRLENNQISLIHPKAFSGLPNLQWLRLENNQISLIHPDAFSGLTDLQWLRLENNQISLIHPKTFSELTNLQRLYLNQNLIAEIKKETFSGLTNLKWLYLNDNRITQIHPEAFSRLINLQWLKLESNQITKVVPVIFSALASLIKLKLEGNRITQIHPEAFSKLINLQELRLNNNQITQIHPETFSELINLQELGLGNNKISQIHPKTFSKLINLQRIWLDNNPFTKFNMKVFLQRINLQELGLDIRQIKAMDTKTRNSLRSKIVRM